MLAHKWPKIQQLGACTLEIIKHRIKDVALAQDWIPCKDDMHFHSTLDAGLFTLDIEHMDDDVMD